jgi:hypothetical protein
MTKKPPKAGDAAKELVALIQSDLEQQPALGKRIIVNELLRLLAPPDPPTDKPDPLAPMTDVEAKYFGEKEMQYGKHAGAKYRDIPLHYLAWLADESKRTWQTLTRYLNSSQVQREWDAEVTEERP